MKNLIVGIVVCMISLVIFTSNSFAFTTNEFKLNINGDLILIDSFPDKYNDVPEPKFHHAVANFTRKNGVWDTVPIMAGYLTCPLTREYYEEFILPKIKIIQKSLDMILKRETLVSFSYVLCYEDAVICVNDNHIPENKRQQYHDSICFELNLLRKQYWMQGWGDFFISGSSKH